MRAACTTWSRRLAHEPFGWRPTTLLIAVRLPVHRLRAGVAAGHHSRGQAVLQNLQAGLRWALLALGRAASERGGSPKGSRSRGIPQMRPFWPSAGPDRRPGTVRQGRGHQGRRERLAARGRAASTSQIVVISPRSAWDRPGTAVGYARGPLRPAFKAWLADRPQAWRIDAGEWCAMDRFTGFKTAAALRNSGRSWDLPVIRLAEDAPGPVPAPGPAGPTRPPRPQQRLPVPGQRTLHRRGPAH